MLDIQTKTTRPERQYAPIARIDSFGCGGTDPDDCHSRLIAASASRYIPGTVSFFSGGTSASRPLGNREKLLFMLSAENEAALRRLVASICESLDDESSHDSSLQSLLSTVCSGRAHYRERLSLIVSSKEDAREQLAAFLSGGSRNSMYRGAARHNPPSVVFVFSGQGSQWWQMGRELLQREPKFREAIAVCDRLFRKHGATWSLLEELTRDEPNSRLDRTSIAQPAIFALQAALVTLWKSWGIEPDAVVGHSIGEAAAAYAAGMLSLEEATRVIFHRGRCMELDQSNGQLLAAAVSADEAQELMAAGGKPVELAAVNSPTSVTFAGEADALKDLASRLRAAKKWRRLLPIPHAFHSEAMNPLRGALLDALGDVSTQKSSIPMISTVTGHPLNGTPLDAEYWWNNLRQTVRFADACEWIVRNDNQIIIEIGPHPVLGSCVAQCAAEVGNNVSLFSSLRRDDDDRNVMLNSAGGLFALGATLNRQAHRPQNPRRSASVARLARPRMMAATSKRMHAFREPI